MVKPGISGEGIPFEGNDLILSIHSVRILPRSPAAASGILSPCEAFLRVGLRHGRGTR